MHRGCPVLSGFAYPVLWVGYPVLSGFAYPGGYDDIIKMTSKAVKCRQEMQTGKFSLRLHKISARQSVWGS
jgi:hypothetical protein